MKLLTFLLGFLLAAGLAVGQSTLTPNISLQVPAYQQTNWQVPIIYDLNLLDGILGGTRTLAAGTTNPPVNVYPVFVTSNGSAVTITNLSGGFSGQVVRIFCGSGDTFTSFANSATMKLSVSPWSCASSATLTLVNVNTVWTETGRSGGAGSSIFYQTVQNGSGTAQTQRPIIQFTGSAVASVVDDSANGRTVVTLTASAGSGVTIQTNGVNNSSQTALNFLNSAATNGLTLTFTNPSGGGVQLGFTGTLTDAGLSSGYSGTGTCSSSPQQFVISTSRNSTPGCAQPALSGISGTASDAQLANGYSGTGSCGSEQWVRVLTRNAGPTCAGRTIAINFIIDGGGAAITTGSKGYVSIPVAATLTGWVVLGDQTGSIDVTIKRATYSGFPTTSSISGSNDPTLTSAQKNENLGPLSGWTSTAISAGDVLEYNVASATTVQRVTVVLNATVP